MNIMRNKIILGGAVLLLLGCSSKEVVQQTPPPPPPPQVPVSHELDLFTCPEGNLRGSGLAGDYDHALENAVNQIAIQIQSSVTSISKAQVGSDVNAEGKESYAHECGNARTRKLVKQVLLEAALRIHLRLGLEEFRVDLGARLDGLEHHFRLLVHLMPAGRHDKPDNDNREEDTYKYRD